MPGPKNNLVASGRHVLLLLVVIGTLMLQRTVGTTSSSEFACRVEFDACINDEVCFGCSYGLGTEDGGVDALIECGERKAYFDPADACTLWARVPCCYNELSSHNCLGNSAFVEYYQCNLDESAAASGVVGDCTFTCSGGSGVEPGDDTDEAEEEEEAGVADDDAVDTDDDEGEANGDRGVVDDDTAAADDDADDDAGTTVGDDGVAAGDDSEDPLGVTTSAQGTCTEEALACLDDPDCSECLMVGGVDGAAEAIGQCAIDRGIDASSDICAFISVTPCCYDELSSHNCLGMSAFVEYFQCFLDESAAAAGVVGGCSTFTCSGGSAVEAGDDTVEAEDEEDAGVADDDAGVTNDDAGVADDDASVVGEDASVVEDDAGIFGDDVTSGVPAKFSASPTAMLTGFFGLAFFVAAAPFLVV